MRLNHFIIAILIFINFNLNAQTILTGVVRDSLDNPIPFASVYLSKTTSGALTENDGSYSLTIPLNGVYELISSCVGYKSNSRTIIADGRLQKINIVLSLKLIQLNEVTIKSKDKNHLKNLTQFTRLFLGETTNSQFCKLTNPNDLHLFYDSPNKTLKGFSTKPLEIENKALGYIIVYDLTDFTYNSETGFLKFSGNPYFQPIDGNSKRNKRTHKNRLIAYYGSRLHLLRAIFSESIADENFRISECKLDPTTKECLEINPLTVRSIIKSHNHNYKALYSNNPIFIKYTENHPELAAGLTGFQAQDYESTIQFSDTVKLYQNGYFEDPYFLTWGGEMGNERIADMLPFDFIPNEVANVNPEESRLLTPIDNYLLHQQGSSSPDQVFVHLDRNMYKPGDTIRFQAYIRDRFTNEFESKSVALYALLFDDNRAKVDSSRFKIDNSTSSGWMTIPVEAQSGKYHFVAFTSMMQNFEPSEAYQTDLLVKGNDKIPEDANTFFDSEYFELKFLPEGGNSVQGVEQRIGFNATDYKGDPVHIEGLLKSSSGLTLATIKSGIYGPGIFVCTPEPGMYVEIIKGNDKEKTWPLPTPMVSGICMRLKPIDNRSFSIEIQSNHDNNDTITVSGVMNSNQIFSHELVLKKKQHMVIVTDQLLSGIATITIFNKDLKPLAERLWYINTDKHLLFNTVRGSNVYTPGQETELSISVTDGLGNPCEGTFSIAVTDSISGHHAEIYTPGIESVFNYNPHFQRNLPYKVLVTGLENLTDEDRDLILMVYGWSKYNWDFKEKVTNREDLENYDMIKIKVPQESKKDHPSEKKLDLISLEVPSIKHLITKNDGEVSLPLDSLASDTRTVILIPNAKDKKQVTEANLRIESKPEYFKTKKFLSLQQTIPKKIIASTPADFQISLGDSTIEIPEVTIKGYPKLKVKYQNIYEERYKYANIKSSDPEIIHTSFDLESVIRRISGMVTITLDDVYLRGSGTSFFGKQVGALFVLDGMPLYSDGWRTAKTISITEIASVTVLKGNQARTIYGLAASGGTIFINTMVHDPSLNNVFTKWAPKNKNNNLLSPVNIYRSSIEFYNPTRSDFDYDPGIQKKSTYYWNPEVYFNGKEPIKIRYLNLKHRGPVLITINGASLNNLVGTGKASYQVK